MYEGSKKFIYKIIQDNMIKKTEIETGVRNRGNLEILSGLNQGDKIIAEGSNKVTSSNDPTAHAEVVAIRGACKKLNTFNLAGCDLYTSCEPCPMCLSAIYWSHIDNIFYANTRDDAKKINFDDSLIYSEIAKKNENRKIPIKQMMRNEALKAFDLWDKKIDKIKY